MSLSEKNTFEVNRGSDLDFSFNWPNGLGGNLNLTGYTVDAYEAHPALQGLLSLRLTTPEQGLITGLIDWNENLPSEQQMSFRIRITNAGRSLTTNLLKVVYK